MKDLRIAVFASHEGSTLQTLIDAIKTKQLNAKISCVISNNSNSKALERAKKHNIPFFHISGYKYPTQELLDDKILETLELTKTNLILLAGYLKKLPEKIVVKYANQILNTHPALLPKYGGKGMYGENVHKAVLEAREKESGVTIHLVDEYYDQGKIIAQIKIPINKNDDVKSLSSIIRLRRFAMRKFYCE
jgi:phosphoribosylglycinamide formyltransferase-1